MTLNFALNTFGEFELPSLRKCILVLNIYRAFVWYSKQPGGGDEVTLV